MTIVEDIIAILGKYSFAWIIQNFARNNKIN